MTERRYDLLAAAACIIPLLGFWTYGLFDLDEGYYAAVSGEMLRSGDWIIPTYSGVPWLEKPIMIYWMGASSIAAFGEALGPRLPSVLATLALCWTIFRFVAVEHGRMAGRLAAVVYGTSIMPAALGRMMMIDALLALFLFISLALCWNRKGLLAGVALGLAMLAKGPVALILFGLIVSVTVVLQPKRRGELLRAALLAVPGALAVLATWYVPAWLASPDAFVQDFLIDQNLRRFTGGDRAHEVPWWTHTIYYWIVLAMGMLPWTPYAIRGAFGRKGDADRFLLVAAVVPLVFFTLSAAKLPHYILPSVAPLACVAGVSLSGRQNPAKTLWIGAAWAVVLLALLQAGFTYWYRTTGQREARSHAVHLRERQGNVLMHNLSGEQPGMSLDPGITNTSLPSMLFYLRGKGRRLIPIGEAIEQENVRWIFTRPGALRREELGGHEVALEDADGQYWVWRVVN